MKLEPTKKLDVEEVLRDLAAYRPRRRGWVWRRRVEDQAIGPFVYRDSAEGLERSVPLPAAQPAHRRQPRRRQDRCRANH